MCVCVEKAGLPIGGEKFWPALVVDGGWQHWCEIVPRQGLLGLHVAGFEWMQTWRMILDVGEK